MPEREGDHGGLFSLSTHWVCAQGHLLPPEGGDRAALSSPSPSGLSPPWVLGWGGEKQQDSVTPDKFWQMGRNLFTGHPAVWGRCWRRGVHWPEGCEGPWGLWFGAGQSWTGLAEEHPTEERTASTLPALRFAPPPSHWTSLLLRPLSRYKDQALCWGCPSQLHLGTFLLHFQILGPNSLSPSSP